MISYTIRITLGRQL